MPLLSLLFLFSVLFLFSAWSIPSHLKKQNILSVLLPLLLILTHGDRGRRGEREAESIFNHKDNSFSLTRPAAPERIWHLRGPRSKSNSYLSVYWNRKDWEQQGNCRGENESGIQGRKYIAGKEEEIIHQHQWKDREEDSWTSFLKYMTLPQGGLDSLRAGHMARMGTWWRAQQLNYSAALLKLSEPTDQLWSQQNCRFQFRRSRVGLKILHFYQVSKWGWGGCSLDHPWRRKTLLKHFGRAQAKKKQGRGLDSHLLLSPVYLQPSLCPKPHCVFTSPLLPTCPSLFCPRSPWRWGTEVCWSLHIGLCSEKELHKYCSCAEKCPSSSMKLCQAISAL